MATMTRQALEQTLRNAQAELLTIDTERDEISILLPAIEAEMQTIKARQEQRQERLKTMQETLAKWTEQQETLSTRERMEAPTLTSGNLSNQVEVCDRERRKADKRLQEELKKKDADRDQAQLEQLRDKHDKLIARQASLQRNRTLTEQTIIDVTKDIGEFEYRDVSTQVELLRNNIEKEQQQVELLRKDFKMFAQEAMQRLEAWPDRQQALREQLPVEDAATTLLEVAISLFDALLRFGAEATKLIPPGMVQKITRWSDLSAWFDIQHKDVWPLFHERSNEPIAVRERKRQFEQLLKLYQQAKRQAKQLEMR